MSRIRALLSDKAIWLLIIGVTFGMLTSLRFASVNGDFDQDYFAALDLRNGNRIYDRLNAHPPLTAVVALPFSYLSRPHAFVAIGFVTILLSVVSAYVVGQQLSFPGKRWLPGLVLVSDVTLSTIALGSLSAVVSLFMLGVWYSHVRGHPRGAGICAGIATHLKLYPALLMLYFVFERDWRAVRWMAATYFIVLFGLWTAMQPGDLARYVEVSIPQNRQVYLDFPANISVAGAIHRAFGSNDGWTTSLSQLPTFALWLEIILDSILLFALALFSHRTADRDARFSVCAIVSILISPLAWKHYLLVLLLPLSRLADDFFGAGSARAGVVLVCFFLLTYFPVLPSEHSPVLGWAQSCVTTFSLLVLLVGMFTWKRSCVVAQSVVAAP